MPPPIRKLLETTQDNKLIIQEQQIFVKWVVEDWKIDPLLKRVGASYNDALYPTYRSVTLSIRSKSINKFASMAKRKGRSKPVETKLVEGLERKLTVPTLNDSSSDLPASSESIQGA